MKVAELREKLEKHNKKEVIQIAAEFYKLIPKAKKEDDNLDAFIDNPAKKKKRTTEKVEIFLEVLELDIERFILDAQSQYYWIPNREVSKKERANWRFKVKKWYKELTNLNRPDKDLNNQAKLLTDLYVLLCDSYKDKYFSSDDAFKAIGVEQDDFCRAVIHLFHEAYGKLDSVKKCISLIVDNNTYGQSSGLMADLIEMYDVNDLKETALIITEQLIQTNNYQPDEKTDYLLTDDFYARLKNNVLTEFGLRLHFALFNKEKGIQFFEKYYNEDQKNKRVRDLVKILYDMGEDEQVIKQLEAARKQGIKLSDTLLDLLNALKKGGAVPTYF